MVNIPRVLAQVLGEPTQPRTRQFLRRIIEAGRL
jgi:polar amino acid transport system ATP-binding protein